MKQKNRREKNIWKKKEKVKTKTKKMNEESQSDRK